ncbi:hypothetical protein [Caballeronia sp. GAFFF3]|uniref:hypothetical protein n=1 Tax=Caballeronia sp. GAFFF3 TaxID=2921759 RepID=UPI0020281AA9|nr:hypothetical protein [Caballeronia sp. GAFFF3]
MQKLSESGKRMGLIKGSLKLVGNVVTLGGVSRLEDAQNAYEQSYGTYMSVHEEAKAVETNIQAHVRDIGLALKNAKKALGKGSVLLRDSAFDKSVPSEHASRVDTLAISTTDYRATSTLTQISKFQKDYESVTSIGAGVATGNAIAIGSWALVSTLGVASTGTAIAELSGVAAYNATMAWFGGGSLAAGGAGMTGGAFVLGGLVALPLMFVAARGTHRKAKEIEEQTVQVESATVAIREQLDTLNHALPVVREKKHESENACRGLVDSVKRLRKVIRPWGFLSILKQKLMRAFGKKPYSPEQEKALFDLTCVLSEFLIWFNGSKTLPDADNAGFLSK